MSSALRFTIVGLMLLTALVLGIFIYNLANPVRLAANLPAETTLQQIFLAAAHPLPAGTLIRDDDLRAVSATTIPHGGILDSPDARIGLRGSLVRNFIDAGKPFTANDVLRPRDRGFIASVLQEGTRAVAIGVDPISGVAGLIWPGDHVDIILTQEIEKAAAARHTLSETVMENVRVIAIDQEIVQGASTDTAAAGKLVRTVTVQVSPAQAEQIAVATHLGKLTLSIRAAMDQVLSSERTTYGADVSPALRKDTPAAPSSTVTVLQGNERKEVSFP